MSLGYDGTLYVLAFDHRGSFQKKMFGIEGDPNEEETRTIADGKKVIFEGFEKALDKGAPKDLAGILVDEQFGAEILREAHSEGATFAMPAERSGQNEFDFQYGDEFGAHISDFDPSFCKVLVRSNPDGDAEMNERQTARLKTLSDWLHQNDRKFLFELLVPAEEDQLAAAGGSTDRYDEEIRPGLMVRTIKSFQAAGVEPDVWKIEGLDRREDSERVAEQARTGGRDGVVCLVLGRGSSEEKVIHWLQTGAGVPGWAGFAVGRTIWWDPLEGYLKSGLERAKAAEQISENYLRLIDAYETAT